MSQLRLVFEHVRHFQWRIAQSIFHDDVDEFDSVGLAELHSIFRGGHFERFIASATALETLEVKMPRIPSYMLEHLDFATAFGQSHFPRLRSFSIRQVSIVPDELTAFLLCHGDTLIRLRLHTLSIEEHQGESWGD